ncbi:MAG TPA: SPFH domain-containing protein [Kofleriaceae bacterium]|nr:SPFH domain-containing protein [Kofleriaceae bacterium]
MDITISLEIGTLVLLGILLFSSTSIVKQGYVGVTVLFGRYRRILRPGLSFRIPFMENVFKRISLQHRSAELVFQAITSDQANVDFKALIIYAVQNAEEETIKRAAFRFVDERSFMQSLVRSIEGSIRAFVATKKQAEILSLRHEIIDAVNSHIEHELNDWGFHLINLQINDISFDEAIMRSMAQVVATNNLKAAAENEAQAQYISKTRVAEAEAHSRRLVAEAERDADRLRGEGNALQRKQIAAGLVEAEEMLAAKRVDSSLLLYTEWLESMKLVASNSHGNILSFDGSLEGFDKTLKQMTLLGRSKSTNGVEAH